MYNGAKAYWKEWRSLINSRTVLCCITLHSTPHVCCIMCAQRMVVFLSHRITLLMRLCAGQSRLYRLFLFFSE